MEWERLPNGKWKPKKTFRKDVSGKYEWDDPRYKKIMENKMKSTTIFCIDCKGYYNLWQPCIHHLPDSYEDSKRKHEFRKAKKEINIIAEPVALEDFESD